MVAALTGCGGSIEHLLGKKLDEYKVEEDDVKVLMERVSEAKRIAALVQPP